MAIRPTIIKDEINGAMDLTSLFWSYHDNGTLSAEDTNGGL